MNNDYIEVDATFVHQTSNAILVANADDVEGWIPLSTVKNLDLDKCGKGECITFEVQEWIAIKNDLI